MTTEITTRAAKGAPLTYIELDENFENLKETADAASDAVIALGGKANASALGVSTSATNMGTFTGTIIPDNQTAKQGMQALETAVETKLPITAPVYDGIARNKAGSWPEPENKIVTTASHADLSATITVADGSAVNNGDTITASFLPYQTHVVSGGGTNTLALSRVANASGSGTSVTIGHDRWDMTSTTVGDTAGYRRLYVGQAAKGRSTMQNLINGQGLDYQQVTAFACENEFGGMGGWFGARMSLEDTGLSGIIALGSYCLVDEDPVSRHAWNRYEQSNLLAGTTPTGSGQFIHVEASLESYWPTVDIDPFNVNPAGSTRIYRLDPGIGTYAARGEADPNNISAYMDFVNNGARARAGIVFGSTSLDEAGGRHPNVLAMPKNYSLGWFSGAGAEAWKVFSTATTGNAYLWHQNALLTSGEADFAISKNSASTGKSVSFRTANSIRWDIGSTATNESGFNAGSDFSIARFSDAGAFLSVPFLIRRSTGRIALSGVVADASYANDAAAAAGGVGLNEIYRNGTALQVRIV